jgi:hypothetical protein
MVVCSLDCSARADEPRRVLDELKEIRLVDVVLPTRQGIDIRKRWAAPRTDIDGFPRTDDTGSPNLGSPDYAGWISALK